MKEFIEIFEFHMILEPTWDSNILYLLRTYNPILIEYILISSPVGLSAHLSFSFKIVLRVNWEYGPNITITVWLIITN